MDDKNYNNKAYKSKVYLMSLKFLWIGKRLRDHQFKIQTPPIHPPTPAEEQQCRSELGQKAMTFHIC